MGELCFLWDSMGNHGRSNVRMKISSIFSNFCSEIKVLLLKKYEIFCLSIKDNDKIMT